MNIKNTLEQLIAGHDLSPGTMQEIMQSCMAGQLNDAELTGFLVALRIKGESVAELTTAATVMQKLAHHIDLGDGLIDIVGTGGDGRNTFNVSTISSFVAAAAGAKVAKHGNRASSSRSGSADLLMAAGFELNLPDSALKQCMDECNIAFLFGPHFHPAMQHAREVRQKLGIRTLFNLLGPLINPAGVKKQMIGVFSEQWLMPIAQVLRSLGSERALVVCAEDGLDEISISTPTHIIDYYQGKFNEWILDPKAYGCFHPSLDDIIVENPTQSLAIAEAVFSGQKGPARDIVLLNSAAALYCNDAKSDFARCLERVALALDSGLAKERFERLKLLTKTLK